MSTYAGYRRNADYGGLHTASFDFTAAAAAAAAVFVFVFGLHAHYIRTTKKFFAFDSNYFLDLKNEID